MRLPTVMFLALAPLAAPAAEWRVVPEGSALKFAGSAQGEAFEGVFKRFDARISFDPAQPALGALQADIELASVDSANAERDEALVGADFFAVQRFPKARFEAGACRADGTRFACSANLTIRDRTQELTFPFTWQPTAGRAKLHAEVDLDRLAYDVGTGDWADEETLARKVRVTVDLVLAPAK